MLARTLADSQVSVHTYHTTKAGHEVKLNLIIPPKLAQSPRKDVPVVIAIHGGGLINGSRRDQYIFEPLQDAIAEHGFILVSADYRLFYPSNGFDMVEDIAALFTWLTSSAFFAALPSDTTADLHRLVVMGFSAGGYMVRLAGIHGAEESQRASPRFTIRALVPYVGMGGDFLDDKWVVAKGSEAEQAQLWDLVKHMYLHDEDKPRKEESDRPYGENVEGFDTAKPTQYIWDYWLATGSFLDVLTGRKGLGAKIGALPHDQRQAALPADLASVIPQLWLAKPENVKMLAPMVLVHGTSDEAVPYEESVHTERQIREAGGRVEFVTVPGANHNLNRPGTEELAEDTLAAHAAAIKFFVDALQ